MYECIFRDVARGGFQGFRNPPLAPRNPAPRPFSQWFYSSKSVMDSRFLKFFILFYAYNKYSERHCGIYLHFAFRRHEQSWDSTLNVETSVSNWLVKIVHSCDQPVIRNVLQTLKDTCNFFMYSRKWNNLLLCVIEKDSPDTKKTILKNKWKTRWVERHEAYEVFFALFSGIVRALEVMASESLFASQYIYIFNNFILFYI